MSKKDRKAAESAPEAAETPASPIVPPAMVGAGKGHGLSRPTPTLTGEDRLREVLDLSAEVPTERVMDAAVAEITKLRKNRRDELRKQR